MKKMGIFILLLIGVLFISHYRNVKPVKAAPTLDESTQETTTVGEPREKDSEATELEAAEPQEEKKEKKEEGAADEEAGEELEEEPEEVTDEQPTKTGKVFSHDENGAILVCILFCAAFMCGYLAAHIIFKGL